jgi:hypothetical protein
MGVSGQHHAPAALCPGERTSGTHCTGGWVGPRAGLQVEMQNKITAKCVLIILHLIWTAAHTSGWDSLRLVSNYLVIYY